MQSRRRPLIVRELLRHNTSSSCVSMRMLQVTILLLTLVYIALHVQLHHRHRHRHHDLDQNDQHHHHQNATTINLHSNRLEKDDDKGAAVTEKAGDSITVAVGYFPNAERPSDENDDSYDSEENSGNTNAADADSDDHGEENGAATTTVDWEDLYKRGMLTAHSCRLRKNEANVTFLQAPDFIIAGSQKAGTTALFALLSCTYM
jgi:hypothetical protein